MERACPGTHWWDGGRRLSGRSPFHPPNARSMWLPGTPHSLSVSDTAGLRS